MNELESILRERLINALKPTELHVINESSQHTGHVGAKNGAQHFAIRIVSPQFNGITRTIRHRLVYTTLSDLMPHPIHALRIDAQATI